MKKKRPPMTEAQRAAHNAYHRDSMRRKRAAMTDDERKAVNAARVAREKERREALPPEELAAKRAERARRQRERMALMTPEQKEEYNAKARARVFKAYYNQTPEQFAARSARNALSTARRRARQRAEREAAKRAAEEARRAQAPGWAKESRQAFELDPHKMYDRILRAIPRGLPFDVRDDVSSAMAVALLDGEIQIDEIEAKARQYIGMHYRSRDWHTTLSFETPVHGYDGLTLGDRL